MQRTLRTNDIPRKIRICGAEYPGGQFGEFFVFGPCLRTREVDFKRDMKEPILDLILEKSECTHQELQGTILNSLEEARATYDEDDLQNIDFPEMMAVDGCLFLVVGFCILGVESFGVELKLLDKHPVFGIGRVRENLDMWLSSMFFVGNQIPFVVLKQLMQLRFFQDLKTRNEWKPPLELAKRALYKLLITEMDQEPVDLIHCLQSYMPGTTSGLHVDIPTTGNTVGEIDDILSARELFVQGITFKPLERELGSRDVCYRPNFFNAVLYLPIFEIDRYTKLVVECTHGYEIAQRDAGIEPESSSLLKLYGELIRSPQDVEILSSQGVIRGTSEGLPAILSNFHATESCVHLNRVRREIKDYPPRLWWRYKRLINYLFVGSAILLLILAFLQIDYTVFGYYRRAYLTSGHIAAEKRSDLELPLCFLRNTTRIMVVGAKRGMLDACDGELGNEASACWV